ELLEMAVDFLNKFAEYRGDVAVFEKERGLAYARLASITREIDSKKKAIPIILKARDIFQTLVDRHPAEGKYRYELAQSLNDLGNLYQSTGQFAGAENALDKARSLFDALVRDHPKQGEYKIGLANTQNGFGFVYNATGRLALAEKAYRKSMEVLE